MQCPGVKMLLQQGFHHPLTLNKAFPFKGGTDDQSLKMITITDHFDRRLRHPRLDPSFNLLCIHHAYLPPLSPRSNDNTCSRPLTLAKLCNWVGALMYVIARCRPLARRSHSASRARPALSARCTPARSMHNSVAPASNASLSVSSAGTVSNVSSPCREKEPACPPGSKRG